MFYQLRKMSQKRKQLSWTNVMWKSILTCVNRNSNHSWRIWIPIGSNHENSNKPTGCRVTATVHATFIGREIEKPTLSMVRAGLRPSIEEKVERVTHNSRYNGESGVSDRQNEHAKTTAWWWAIASSRTSFWCVHLSGGQNEFLRHIVLYFNALPTQFKLLSNVSVVHIIIGGWAQTCIAFLWTICKYDMVETTHTDCIIIWKKQWNMPKQRLPTS